MSQSASEKDVVAGRYGRVFFQLAESEKKMKPVTKDVSVLRGMCQVDDGKWEAIVNPTLTPARQNEIVTALVKSLKLSPLTQNFLRVLVERDRLIMLPRILEHFDSAHKESMGQVDATVKSAAPLPKTAMTNLAKSLKSKTGLDVNLTQKVDPNVLGGVILEIGSLMVDASVGSRLNKLRQTMKG